MPHRIGIIFCGFPKKELSVIKYLVLEQNNHQSSFEFELMPTNFNNSFFSILSSHRPQNRKDIEAQAEAFIPEYKKWLETEATYYRLYLDYPENIVLITNMRFDDYYYIASPTNCRIVALGHWKRVMAPPSVVEFILTMLTDVAIEIACEKSLPNHQTTKGCISDFTATLDEARYASLTGYICSFCESMIIKNGGVILLQDIKTLSGRKWIGNIDDMKSAAAISRKLGYSLFVTKGIKPTLFERSAEILKEEWVKELIKIIGSFVAAGFAIWFGLKIS
jgi:hypothetical protein